MLKFKLAKALKEIQLPNKPKYIRMGKTAFKMIRNRVTKRGKMANGSSVPKLRSETKSGSYYKIPVDDPRFKGGGRVRPEFVPPGETRAEKSKRWVRIYNSYAQAKIKAGKRPVKDGNLSGSMWKMPGLSFKTMKGKIARKRGQGARTGRDMMISLRGLTHAITVYFAASSISGGFKTNARGVRKPKKVSNKTKAKAVGRKNQMDRKPAWLILELSDKELGFLNKLFFNKLAN